MTAFARETVVLRPVFAMLRTVILAAAVASASAFAPMAGFGRTATKARTGVNLIKFPFPTSICAGTGFGPQA